MKVYQSTEDIPVFRQAVITIGTFDGVHLGHQQILAQLKAEAGRIGGETVIVTFHPHPRKVVAGNRQPILLINTIAEKISLLEQNGIDHLVIVPFTPEFSQLTPHEYVDSFLVRRFHPHTVIIGYDHRFGQGREGDYRLLEQYSAEFGFQLKEIPAQVIEENTVSSTRIREAVLNGQITMANALLGYDFFFSGIVVPGDRLGRTIGFPTANIQVTEAEKLVPGNGVYVVEITIDGFPGSYQGMMNIGTRPTVDGRTRKIEVNIFGFDADIYGRPVRVQVKKYLRGEQKFSGLDALKAQLASDRENALAAFRRSS
ncbi:MAG: bifunctional riboflavin kinase/FAD synthetase [Candidatus Pseudobacter hemicellulosilyticus]|uniref:Riboflavin biosynthesis protein n=1 Tax=Candidatus Pseudobacter hemicellulosilyticus TaxID=3121375 RepID=A0AAJ5WNR2_9BACT|nr:MAG: bifunctional riboflavin kinase/FAD synthetase [Pseudobacter sp.]